MKTGRPKIEIDFAEVDKLCQIQCTGEEIASFFGISYDTLESPFSVVIIMRYLCR